MRADVDACLGRTKTFGGLNADGGSAFLVEAPVSSKSLASVEVLNDLVFAIAIGLVLRKVESINHSIGKLYEMCISRDIVRRYRRWGFF